jgi:predicted membrane metal-binding protein
VSVSPHRYAAALCVGLAAANLIRASGLVALGATAALAAGAVAVSDDHRPHVLVAALLFLGWWWGGARLDALDRSELLARVDTAERSVLIVTAPPRRSRFEMRVPAEVHRFGRFHFREAVLLELPLGRSPPQGAVIETVATVRLPRPAKNGFDESTWLRHRGVHVVLHADRWRLIGRRGGIGGIADRLREGLARSIAPGLEAERRGIVEGVVLGDEQSLDDGLRQDFRASGLYHLLSQFPVSVPQERRRPWGADADNSVAAGARASSAAVGQPVIGSRVVRQPGQVRAERLDELVRGAGP